jgi:hypothetical protein
VETRERPCRPPHGRIELIGRLAVEIGSTSPRQTPVAHAEPFVAEARLAAMSALQSPAEQLAMHHEILAADAELARSGRSSVNRLPIVGRHVLVQYDFPQLR